MSQALGNSSEQKRKKPDTHLPYKSVERVTGRPLRK